MEQKTTLEPGEWNTAGGVSTDGRRAGERAEELGIDYCPCCKRATSSVQSMNPKLVMILVWFAVKADETDAGYTNWRLDPPKWLPDGYMPPVLRHFGLLEQETVEEENEATGTLTRKRVEASYRLTRWGLDFLEGRATACEHVRIDSKTKKLVERFGDNLTVEQVLERPFSLFQAKQDIAALNEVRHVKNSKELCQFVPSTHRKKKSAQPAAS